MGSSNQTLKYTWWLRSSKIVKQGVRSYGSLNFRWQTFQFSYGIHFFLYMRHNFRILARWNFHIKLLDKIDGHVSSNSLGMCMKRTWSKRMYQLNNVIGHTVSSVATLIKHRQIFFPKINGFPSCHSLRFVCFYIVPTVENLIFTCPYRKDLPIFIGWDLRNS